MSADNGIYILVMKDNQCRIAEGQAIENIYYENSNKVNPVEVYKYFKDAEQIHLSNIEKEIARLYGGVINDDFFPVLEYGVLYITIDMVWDDIVKSYNESVRWSDKTFDLHCLCGCGMIKFHHVKDEDGNTIYVEHYQPSFFALQENLIDIIWRRIKCAWRMLLGKEYFLYEVVVEDEDIAKFKEWVGDM